MISEAEPQDAHVRQADKLFRASGFTLAAMQFPRSPEALDALKAFNGLPSEARVPFAWHYFPNAWCRDHWPLMTPPRAGELRGIRAIAEEAER